MTFMLNKKNLKGNFKKFSLTKEHIKDKSQTTLIKFPKYLYKSKASKKSLDLWCLSALKSKGFFFANFPFLIGLRSNVGFHPNVGAHPIVYSGAKQQGKPESKRDISAYATSNNTMTSSLNGILLVNFPEKERNFLVKTLAAENKIPLITQSTGLLLKDPHPRNLDDLLGVDDPIQVLFDKVKTSAPCICVRVVKIIH